MKFRDIATFPDAVDLEMRADKADEQQARDVQVRLADFEDAKQKLKNLNQERLEVLAAQVDRELRRYLTTYEYERLQLEKRLGGTHRPRSS